MLLVTVVNLVDSLVRDMRAYCLVTTEMLADHMMVWYQATTSLSETGSLSNSEQASANNKITHWHSSL